MIPNRHPCLLKYNTARKAANKAAQESDIQDGTFTQSYIQNHPYELVGVADARYGEEGVEGVLGLPILGISDTWAELEAGTSRVVLKAVDE